MVNDATCTRQSRQVRKPVQMTLVHLLTSGVELSPADVLEKSTSATTVCPMPCRWDPSQVRLVGGGWRLDRSLLVIHST